MNKHTMKNPRKIDCSHFNRNIEKFSIPVHMDPWLLYDVALRVYIVNNELCLAAKANHND